MLFRSGRVLTVLAGDDAAAVATMAIGGAGATNAALFAVAILAGRRPELREQLRRYREEQARQVLDATVPSA